MKTYLMGIALASMSSSVGAQSDNDLSTEEQCAVVTSWEDGTTMFIVQDKEQFEKDQVVIAFSNDNWTIKPQSSVGRITIENADGVKLSRDGWAAGSVTFVVGTNYNGVFELFFDTNGFRVFRGDVVIGSYTSTPVSSALLRFMECHNRFVAAKEERERQEYLAKLPKNPFAE